MKTHLFFSIIIDGNEIIKLVDRVGFFSLKCFISTVTINDNFVYSLLFVQLNTFLECALPSLVSSK